jgi:putative tryptophan/tyrosine transport system substrate-binding protein
VTGFVSGDVWLNAKRMELLKEAIPVATRVAILANPTNPAFAQEIGEADKAARSLKIQTDVLGVSDPAALPKAFADAGSRQISALLVVPDGMLWAHRADIVRLAAEKRLPAMYWTSDYTDVGGR